MSSKPSNEGQDLPSYNDVITGDHSTSHSHVRSSVQNEVHSELLNLAIRFSSVQGDKLHHLQQNDERALNLLIPHIKTFLAEYSETTLPMATLILIPAGTVSPLAVPADDDLRSADDFGRVVTVAYEKGEERSTVWNSADMVERLASYLRPRSDELPPRPSQESSPPVKAAASKKSFFSRRASAAGPAVPAGDVKSAELPKVSMVVKAEEVVFRAESELGLYENQTVWGIAIRVRINAGKQGY